MKNKVLVMVLVLLMVFTCTAAAFAESGIMPLDTNSVHFYIERTSGTTADVDIVVYFTSEADEYSVVVYLQKLVNGTWINDSTNPEYVFFNNGFNSYSCLFAHDYDSLVRGTTYRIKCISRDKYDNGSEYRTTTYSNPF